ncbi:MAG TPA: acyl carrier protein [Lapidilactobacillus dextrinicus]|jgi:acyl carrier protein|uniref:Acyl carrier protein n=1 Tax=Lapidilactobacillus dextrinicus TaxID=51664 RepID=A0A921B2G7_9LACO|nr:acyl carrier protein [Lapidilactobacillus dextrinicus]HJE14948.1 acyl carrier protein [Lapidilactobacillus dextrinicus]
MTEAEAFDKITGLIADRFDVEKEAITKQTKIKDDLSADSIDLVEFVLELEDTFDDEIPDEDAEKIITVGDAVDYVMAHQAA